MNIRHIQRQIKYNLDSFFAVLLIILLSPLFLIIAIAIKIDDGGPVLFRQARLGISGQIFHIWKFRTMVVDAERYLDYRGHVINPNRVTRLGRFLRYLSLDELPQLINIIKGEMSIVGPRPALPDHLLRYTEVQKRRLLMKPGVTGYSQVNGRNKLKWSIRIRYDIWYVENYSLWLDLKILVKTISVVLKREGIVIDRNPDQVDDLEPAIENISVENRAGQ